MRAPVSSLVARDRVFLVSMYALQYGVSELCLFKRVLLEDINRDILGLYPVKSTTIGKI